MMKIIIFFIFVSILHNTSAASDLVCQLLELHNYPCETHDVVTDDGYVVTVHRIPPRNNNTNTPLKPFILMHGLIGSAADFVLSGKQRSLGCMLHERGYDVWLPNARGTTYSKRHLLYDSSQPAFWNFTWHEIGYYDLPAIIDHVSNRTGHRDMHYVAHSQGSTIFFVMLSERPEYNERIVSASLMAPVAFLEHLESPPLRLMASESNKIETLLNHLGLHELFPSTALNQLGGHLFCGKGVPTQYLCILVMYLSVGFSDFEMDRSLFPKIFETTPAGISRKQFQHFGQLVNTGKFQKYDYKSKQENYRRYRQKTPPEYNLGNVRVPLNLFYGSKDLLMAKPDVFRLASHLNNSRFTMNEIRGFNHIDLLYSSEAPRFIYKKILSDTKQYYS